jgi:hypothetical protein
MNAINGVLMVVNGNHDAVISTSNRLVNTRHINNIHSLNEILSVTMQINGESTALGKSDHASDTEPLNCISGQPRTVFRLLLCVQLALYLCLNT